MTACKIFVRNLQCFDSSACAGWFNPDQTHTQSATRSACSRDKDYRARSGESWKICENSCRSRPILASVDGAIRCLCWMRPRRLAVGTTRLNAHVLTERLSKRSLLPNKLRCLLNRRRADRRFSGKPCGSCRVICSLSHARLRGYLYTRLFPSHSRCCFVRHPSWSNRSDARCSHVGRRKRSSRDRGNCSCEVAPIDPAVTTLIARDLVESHSLTLSFAWRIFWNSNSKFAD